MDNSMANSGCPSKYLVGSDNRKPLISNTAPIEGTVFGVLIMPVGKN